MLAFPGYRPSRRVATSAALGAGALLLPLAAQAQMPDRYTLDQYFGQGVPGYGEQLGTTVMSRQRPEYQPLGVRLGDFIVHPELDEGIGYNSNIIGQVPAKDSLTEATTGTLTFGSDWKRDSLGGSISVTNEQFPGLPDQNQTNWSGALGGSIDIGRDKLTLAVSHLHAFILPYGIDVVSFNRPGTLYSAPIPYDVNDVRIGYTTVFNRLSITPSFDFTNITLGSTQYFGLNGFVPPPPVNGFIAGQPENLNYLDHNTYTGAVEARYQYAPLRDIVVVARGTEIEYGNSNANLFGPNRSGEAVDLLAGLDYTANGVWQYRALVGYELRNYNNYGSHSAPVFEGSVAWQPSGLDTVTLKALRTIDDAVDQNIAGFIYTSGRLQWDHELRRNILLSAYGSIQHASYLQTNNGQETFFGAGGGVTYLMNRTIHVALTYDWVDHNGQNGYGPNFTQNVALLQFRFAL